MAGENFNFYEESKDFRIWLNVEVHGKKIVMPPSNMLINEAKAHLTFLALALERNLANPNLPYFSEADLASDEIVIDLISQSKTYPNHDIGYYKEYHLISCGNMVIRNNTDRYTVSICVNNIRWEKRRVVWECRFEEELVTACNELLDRFEADFAKFHIIDDFVKRCQTTDETTTYVIHSVEVRDTLYEYPFNDYNNRYLDTECIAFYLYKQTRFLTFVEASFDSLQNMDVSQFLTEANWRKY